MKPRPASLYEAGFRAGLLWTAAWCPAGPWLDPEYARGFHDGLDAQRGLGDYESLQCMGCGGIGHDDEICG